MLEKAAFGSTRMYLHYHYANVLSQITQRTHKGPLIKERV